MLKRIKSILFVVCVVVVFTAQTNRPDEKGQQHAPAARPAPATRPAPAARPAPVAYNNQARPQVQTRREAPQQTVYRQPTVKSFISQPPHQGNATPRVYAVPASAPVENNRLVHQHVAYRQPTARSFVSQPFYQRNEASRVDTFPASVPAENNLLFNRQHHNNWQPLYNFYNNQYQFYPYVNVTSLVELSANYVTVLFNGQAYFYDRGSFYVQDPQGYLAVPPPIGIIVNVIPQHARQIIVDGQIYYRYKGVFYIQVAQGYQVVGPVQ